VSAAAVRLPWYRRLTFRLAALVALLLLGFDFVAPHVFELMDRWLIRQGSPLILVATNGEKHADESLALRGAVDELAATLLASEPTQSATDLAALHAAIAAWHGGIPTAFLVCDQNLRVHAASPSLQVQLGAPVPTERPDWTSLSWSPLRRDGALVGWLCIPGPPHDAYLFGGAVGSDESGHTDSGELISDAAVISQEEMDARIERMRIAGLVATWLLRLGLAAIVAWLFSWLVTRRLARVAAVARADLDSTATFGNAARGSDEIAALAQALVESRERVRSLLGELGARDQARREWIAQVSHDLRTPLTALVARLEGALPTADRLLAQCAAEPARGAANELRSAIDVALADADRVALLARDLLDAARLDLPNQLELEPVLVAELVTRVGEELAPLAAKSGLSLRTTPAAGLPAVTGDGRRLLRVLENLVRNAIEHAHNHVEVRATSTANGVRVEVLDDGPGLLADPSASDARRADAAGLGLQVARRILDAHGSGLELANRPEGGCCSRFVLALNT
jgi:signal transduction histidine kinase